MRLGCDLMHRRRGLATWIGLLGLAAFYALPLTQLIVTSLKTPLEAVNHPADYVFTPTLDAYESFFKEDWVSALKNSFIIGGSTAVLTLMLATPAAYAFSRSGGRLLTGGLALLIFLQMIPHTSMAIPLFRVLHEWGLLGSLQGVILGDVATVLPFAILVLRPFYGGVPLDLEDAAAVDGAGRFRTFRSIVLPLVANGVITVGMLVFIIAWGEFLFAILFLTDPTTYPVSALLQQRLAAFLTDWPGLMALASMAALPIAFIVLFGQRWLSRGISIGAVK
jgi:multiple sugar transport system permease protein